MFSGFSYLVANIRRSESCDKESTIKGEINVKTIDLDEKSDIKSTTITPFLPKFVRKCEEEDYFVCSYYKYGYKLFSGLVDIGGNVLKNYCVSRDNDRIIEIITFQNDLILAGDQKVEWFHIKEEKPKKSFSYSDICHEGYNNCISRGLCTDPCCAYLSTGELFAGVNEYLEVFDPHKEKTTFKFTYEIGVDLDANCVNEYGKKTKTLLVGHGKGVDFFRPNESSKNVMRLKVASENVELYDISYVNHIACDESTHKVVFEEGYSKSSLLFYDIRKPDKLLKGLRYDPNIGNDGKVIGTGNDLGVFFMDLFRVESNQKKAFFIANRNEYSFSETRKETEITLSKYDKSYTENISFEGEVIGKKLEIDGFNSIGVHVFKDSYDFKMIKLDRKERLEFLCCLEENMNFSIRISNFEEIKTFKVLLSLM